MQNQTATKSTVQLETRSTALSKPLQIACAFILGSVILYGAGFVSTAAVHNAAHDVRHAQVFPCH
jgi:cobalt transporter subunit CbtB